MSKLLELKGDEKFVPLVCTFTTLEGADVSGPPVRLILPQKKVVADESDSDSE